MGKAKLVWGGIVVVALVFAGFLIYQGKIKKGESPAGVNQDGSGAGKSLESVLPQEEMPGGDLSGEDETDYNAVCENGEWIKVADTSGEISTVKGKLRKTYPDDESNAFKSYRYYIEGAENLGITGEKLLKLDYLEDREVELQGVKNAAKKEITVSQVKCGGKETDKSVLDQRKAQMNWLAANINSIASQKAKHQKWTIDIVDFVDEKNVYVEYYDTVEDDENSDIEDDTSRRILVELTAKSGGAYDANVSAYWEMGEDDYVLKTGTDKFEEAESAASYQYDPEDKTWERID